MKCSPIADQGGVYVFRRIFIEAPTVLLLLLWAWCLLKADDAMLRVIIPFMVGSFDWIHYFAG